MKAFWIYFYDLNDLNYGLQKMITQGVTPKDALKGFVLFCKENKLKADYQGVEEVEL